MSLAGSFNFNVEQIVKSGKCSDPSGRNDVRAIPTVAAQRRGSAGRAWDLADISHETAPIPGGIRFGPMFAAGDPEEAGYASTPVSPVRRWHLDEAFVKING